MPPIAAARPLVLLAVLAGATAGGLRAQSTLGADGSAAALTVGAPAPAGFHAEGQDPYWTLAVDPAAATVTWGRLGKPDLTLAYAPPLPADTAGTVRYYFRGDQRLKASFTEVPCRDAETGNAYPYAALVEVGGRAYRGCATRAE